MIVLIYYLRIRRKKKLFFILIKIREAWEDTKVAEQKKSNILEEGVQGHRFGKKLTNNDYGTVAFLLSRNDILPNKDKNAKSFSDIELTYNCIYFLIGYEQNSNSTTEMMYVGQAGIRENNQSVLDRLNEHAWKGTDPAKYLDKWTDIVVVTNEKKAWGATELDALEHIFWSLIPVGNRYNSIKPSCTGADLSKFTEAVKQIKEYLDYLQFTMFKEKTDAVLTQNISDIARAKSEIPVDLDRGTARIPNITTPPRIVAKMLELLPSEIWNDETKFLDPACKDGGFLRAIYDKLVKDPKLIAKYNGNVDSLKNKILSNLYGIALNQNSKAVTIKNLNGFGYNVTVVTNYVNKLRENKLADIIKEEFGEDMTFDVVIGNPPYQETTGGGNNGGKVIYDSFILNGLSISDKLCMIVKNNWMNSDALKGLRDVVIKSGLKTLINYSLLGDIFPNMGIAASIIYIDKNYNGAIDYKEIVKDKVVNEYVEDMKNSEFIPASKYEYSIVSKVKAITKDSFAHHVVGTNPFGISTNGAISNGFVDESVIKTDYYNIGLKYVDNFTYTNLDCFTKNIELVDKYKIICPKQIHKTNNPIPSVLGLRPNNICSGSFSLMYCDADVEKASNVAKYIKTRFFRFLTYCLADSLCGLKAYRVSLVPDQDFTSASNIDWSQSIANIDKQLYKKYNLSEEEVAYIESTIKSLDTTVEASPTMRFTLQEAEANLINRRIQNEEF